MTWQWVTLILGLSILGVVLICVSVLEKTSVWQGTAFGYSTTVTRIGAREGATDDTSNG